MKAVIASCSKDKKERPTAVKIGHKCKPKKKRRLLRARTFYYYARGNGEQRMFTLDDAIPGYESRIPDPSRVTLTNVFVDGLLQPPEVYAVYPGVLLFVSDQAPPADTRIIAQFVVITV